MSLQTALLRAEFRYLQDLTDLARRHYHRSGLQAYYEFYRRKMDRMEVIADQLDAHRFGGEL